MIPVSCIAWYTLYQAGTSAQWRILGIMHVIASITPGSRHQHACSESYLVQSLQLVPAILQLCIQELDKLRGELGVGA